MNRVFKTILLWILISALPVQGMAAAINASCGPSHHDKATAIAVMPVVHDETMATAHEHDDKTASLHRHGHADAGLFSDTHHTTSAPLADSSPHAKQHVHQHSSCSACAACCFGAAAPPPAVAQAPVPAGAFAAVLPPVVLFSGYIPAGLERPPRHLSD